MRMYVRDCIYARTSMYILCMCDVYVLLMYTTCNLYGAVTSQATMYSFIHRHHYFCIRNENVNYIGISQVVVHLSACGAECIIIHGVRMKSSTQQKVSQLVQNCQYLPEISNSTTLTIPTRDPKAV